MSGCLALKPALRKQRVTIMLDAGLVEYCKVQVGVKLTHGNDPTILYSETLKLIVGHEYAPCVMLIG